MPGIAALDHVAVTVPTERLEEARSFYSQVLGLQEMSRPDAKLGRPGIWYRLSNAELHIQCRDGAAAERSDRHLALAVDRLPSFKERLRARGAEVEEAQPLGGRERFFCRDPFGNRIEFVQLAS